MKLSLRQAILFLVGGAAGTAGVQSASTSVHADVVTVHQGDTTWGFAKKYGTTVKKIVKDNHLKNGGHDIYVNQKLDIDNNKAAKGISAYAETTSQASSNTTATSTAQTQAQSAVSQAPSYNSANTSTDQTNTTTQNYNSGTTVQAQAPARTQSATPAASSSEEAAKAWIVARESGGNYNAVNASSGAYGKYQLLPGYLHGDYSAANQDRTANNYVHGRYGSWSAAKAFWEAHGWY